MKLILILILVCRNIYCGVEWTNGLDGVSGIKVYLTKQGLYLSGLVPNTAGGLKTD